MANGVSTPAAGWGAGPMGYQPPVASGGYLNPSLIFGGNPGLAPALRQPLSGIVLPNLQPGANLGGAQGQGSSFGQGSGGALQDPAMASVNYSQAPNAGPQKIWTADNLPTAPAPTPGQQAVAAAIANQPAKPTPWITTPMDNLLSALPPQQSWGRGQSGNFTGTSMLFRR